MKHISKIRLEELSSFPSLLSTTEQNHLETCSNCTFTLKQLSKMDTLLKDKASKMNLNSIDFSSKILATISTTVQIGNQNKQPFPIAIFGFLFGIAILLIAINFIQIKESYTFLNTLFKTNNLFKIIIVVIAYVLVKGVSNLKLKITT